MPGMLRYFQERTGVRTTKNVVFVTTKWTTPPRQSELDLETELKMSEHWARHPEQGWRMVRLENKTPEAAWALVKLCLADAFTFDTEKIIVEVADMKKSFQMIGYRSLIYNLESLLKSQSDMAKELKARGRMVGVLWDDLVDNDKKIRAILSEIPPTTLDWILLFFGIGFDRSGEILF